MKWLGLAAMALAATAEAGVRCDAVRIDRLAACAEGLGGVVLGPDAAQAEGIVAAIEAGRPVFESVFGQPAPAYAVVFDNPTGAEIAGLKAAGYPAVLPWVDAGPLVAQFEQKLRESIRASIPNLDKQQEDKIVADKLDELRANIGGPSAAAHEMGHLWFSRVFWSDFADGDETEIPKHYGSPGPDWLDEVSGLVFENEATADTRRMRFRDLWAEGQGIAPLPDFLAMAHPEQGKTRETPPGAPTSGSRVVIAAGPPGGARATSAFYAQGRVFADFLIAEGKPGVLGVIATAMAKGTSFDEWLAAEGAAQGLPADAAALNLRWMEWATATYGAPG